MSQVRRIVTWGALLAAGIGAVAIWRWIDAIPSREEAELIAEIRESLHESPPAWLPGDEPYRAGVWDEVRRAYRGLGERPLWIANGAPKSMANEFAIALARASDDGLDPASYGYLAIRTALKLPPRGAGEQTREESASMAALDVRLTAAFLRFMRDRHDGRLPERALDSDWCALRETVDAPDLLRRALAAGSLTEAMARTERDDPDYAGLRRAAVAYNRIVRTGGWPEVPTGRTLSRGDDDSRCLILRRRLAATGDLTDSAEGTRFDAVLEKGLRRFQARHGIPVNGKLDEATRLALNVSASDRLRTIGLNLERSRWRPQSVPGPCIWVNIPESRLRVRSGGLDSLEMRAVVGTPSHPTPVFSDSITYLDFNPTWRVPRRILVEEIVPALRKDSGYMDKNNMKVLRVKRRVPAEVHPETVPWEAAAEDTFGYLVFQEGGETNPLGRIKLMCPNEYDVYLHDTPARGYFGSPDRFQSHGCVRVEHPVELAELALRGTAVGSRDSIEAIISRKEMRRVLVANPLPVHVDYRTVWVDSLGVVQFRRDVYGLDRRLEAALRSGRVSDFVINPPGEWKGAAVDSARTAAGPRAE